MFSTKIWFQYGSPLQFSFSLIPGRLIIILGEVTTITQTKITPGKKIIKSTREAIFTRFCGPESQVRIIFFRFKFYFLMLSSLAIYT